MQAVETVDVSWIDAGMVRTFFEKEETAQRNPRAWGQRITIVDAASLRLQRP